MTVAAGYVNIYIAGPMRGIEHYNFPLFDECRDWIHREGWFANPRQRPKLNVISPADEDRRRGTTTETGTLEDGDYVVTWHGEGQGDEAIHSLMRHDLAIVTTVDRLYLLPGWERSTGAVAEVRVAIACGVQLWEWFPAVDKITGYASATVLEHKRAMEKIHDTEWAIPVDRSVPKVGLGQFWTRQVKDSYERLNERGEAWRTWLNQYSPITDENGKVKVPLNYDEVREYNPDDWPPAYLGGGEWAGKQAPSQDEVRIVDPETGGEKGQKLDRYDLLPVEALRLVARHYGLGAQKYPARNWEKGYAWSLSYGAALRHLNAFWSGDDFDRDPELGESTPHLAAAAFHILALLHFSTYDVGTDDRTKAVHVGRSIIAEILAEKGLTVSDKPRVTTWQEAPADQHVHSDWSEKRAERKPWAEYERLEAEVLRSLPFGAESPVRNRFADQYRKLARLTEAAWSSGPPLEEL